MKFSPSLANSKAKIGFGIVSTQTITPYLRDKKFLSYFTSHEKQYCFRKKRSTESLAARLAAKEAFWDAAGIASPKKKHSATEWKKIGVERKQPGPPSLVVSPSLLKKLELPTSCRFLLSLTHEKDFAVAALIITQ